jgi:hypothetical protein
LRELCFAGYRNLPPASEILRLSSDGRSQASLARYGLFVRDRRKRCTSDTFTLVTGKVNLL